ncbi:TetR/AcrR family transcriptional regulator [Streptococcus pneumoniae]
MIIETKKRIQAAFIKLYQEGYARMSITKLCQQVPIARTTFYDYYEHLDQVLEEIENELIASILALGVVRREVDEPFSDLFDAVLDYMKEHESAFTALMIAEPDSRFLAKWKTALKVHLDMEFPQGKKDDNRELRLEMVASAILGGYQYFLEQKCVVNHIELRASMVQAVSLLDDFL